MLNTNCKPENVKRKYISCPSYKPLVTKINNIIHNNNMNIQLAEKPIQTNRQTIYSKIKDKVGLESKKNAVFKIKCKNCSFVDFQKTNNLDVHRTFNTILKRKNTRISKHQQEYPSHKIYKKPTDIKATNSKKSINLARQILMESRP